MVALPAMVVFQIARKRVRAAALPNFNESVLSRLEAVIGHAEAHVRNGAQTIDASTFADKAILDLKCDLHVDERLEQTQLSVEEVQGSTIGTPVTGVEDDVPDGPRIESLGRRLGPRLSGCRIDVGDDPEGVSEMVGPV